MSSDLERALSKLRFDEQVLGYSLMTKAGRPFVSFSFPSELFPRVRDSINLYKTDLRLMTIDTDRGLVVLSPVDMNWILTVLYVTELQLGLAIAKTKNVLRLLEGIELPPPPDEFEESAESNLKVLESIAMQAASTSPEAIEPEFVVPEPEDLIEIEPELNLEEAKPPEAFNVQPTTIPKRGPSYGDAINLDSDLHNEMKQAHGNFGFDVLMLVDSTVTVAEIADSMFQPNERVTELIKWAASKGIVEAPLCDEGTVAISEDTMGRFVKCPKFLGDLSKIQNGDIEILRLCDGSRTTEEIAEILGIQNSNVIQTIAGNKKFGIKMIGKTV
ncbi:MAG: hypothetical protein ACFFEU_08825 [Candidatus Thorarchaeota archaeon]